MELHGRVLGVPYDFRRPIWNKLKSRYWNPDDERVFIPRAFGVGWDINFHRLRELYPKLFYAVVCLMVLCQVMRIAAYIRLIFKKKRATEQRRQAIPLPAS